AGCATVTSYETSSAEQVKWIVTDSGAAVVICGDDDRRKVLESALADVDADPVVFVMDGGGLDELIARGEHITDEQVMERAQSVTQQGLATLVYTSGTTGMPKRCEPAVRNVGWPGTQARSLSTEALHPDAVRLVFLPLAHSFARIVQVGSVATGAKSAYSTGLDKLTEELQIVRPT